MDAVKAFNSELSALYEVKPPISKAKMSTITRSAIKAIKFYKHVVQSVEKFIQKCKPEYKVPGLYVIDSIVRQSRHQFGPDKDLFAPRFAKNMQNTFANLFSCPPEDKGKIIRVLNLWQKNSVFTPDVIQPLFDQLADPNNPIHRETVTASNGLTAAVDRSPPSNISKGSGIASLNKNTMNLPTDANTPHWLKSQIDATNKAIMELTSSSAQQAKASSNTGLDLLQQIQQLQHFILSQTTQKQERTQSDQVVFDKKLLDFDYGDDDEENPSPHQQSNNTDNFNSILQNPEILRQLTALQQQMSQHQIRQQQLEIEEKMRKLKEMKQQEEEFDKHLAQTVPKLPFASECDLKQYQEPAVTTSLPDLSVPPPGYPKQGQREETHDSEVECIDDESNDRDRNVEVINLLDRSPSSSPSQNSSRRRHSRSRSRDRRRNRRSRSRSSRSRTRSPKSKRKRRTRSKSRDRVYDSEKDRERRKKGLPPIKRNHLSVCSTTLWVGHLSKLVQQEELSDTFGEFGDIVSIDVIPPRGCAFICMNRRQDASRALTRLKDYKLHGKNIMLAWAPGKGVKGRDYKDYWEIDLGVSYIPWSRLSKKTDFVALEEGGALDEDTMPDNLKETIIEQLQKRKDELQAENKMMEDMPANPSYIPLPEGIPAPPVPPVLAAALPSVMTVPPPMMGASNSPAAPAIDTSQPPPNMSPNSKAAGGLSVLPGASLPLPQLRPRIPVMAEPGLMMPPFPFTSLPPPLGMAVSNMMGNLPIGVPPPTMQGLIMQQQMMAIPTTAASPFTSGAMLPPMSVPSGAPPNIRDKVSGLSVGPSDVCGSAPFMTGQTLGMGNHKEDDSMDLEDECGDDEKLRLAKSSQNIQGIDKMAIDDRSRNDGRNRDNEDRNRVDRGRDRDRSDRDRDRDRRERNRERDRDKDRDYRDRERDYRDRGRDRDRRRRSRDRDDRRSRDRDYHNRTRDRDNRRDRSRTNDRDRNRENKVRDKEPESEVRDDAKRDENKKEPVNQWVEVPMTNEEKPSLLQRLRNIAEGGGDHVPRPEGDGAIFGGSMPRMNEPSSRHGPPIVINLNNSGMPRPGFGPRGPMVDVFRPEFGPGSRPNDFGPRFGPGDRISPGRQFDDDDCRRQGFDPRGRGRIGDQNDDRGRSRFDFGGPRPLMEAHFDGPPVHPDDRRGAVMHPDDMRGPPLHQDGMMCPPDEMRGVPGPMFVDDFQPMGDDLRMRFGPRGIMGPMPRGPMGPHGPGPVSLFGPRGPGIRPLMGRPPNIWMDSQPPSNIGDNFARPPFDDRPGGPNRRGPGPGSGPRFRGERTRDRQSRWSKEDVKEPVNKDKRIEPDKKEAEVAQEESEVEQPSRDTHTPCHDEPPEPVPEPVSDPVIKVPEDNMHNNVESVPPVVEQREWERDTHTPLHDEPQISEDVTQRDEVPPVPEETEA